MAATSRDPEEWAKATEAARKTRQAVAEEVARLIGSQVAANIVSNDEMGGRARLAGALRDLAAAERRQDEVAVRAALMGGIEAMATWVARLDNAAVPQRSSNGNGAAPASA